MIILICAAFVSSIYSYSLPSIDNNTIILDSLRGKKILFVNTASNSQYATQFESLESLHQLVGDSLVIITIPSNSFGNEPLSDSAIQSQVTNFNLHYFVTKKLEVRGVNIAGVYDWLTKKSLNNVSNNQVRGDFTKYLIDETGNLVGFFAPSVDPMSDEFLSALQTNN